MIPVLRWSVARIYCFWACCAFIRDSKDELFAGSFLLLTAQLKPIIMVL